ncbi:hypothetical protein [Tepidibacter mesophilus]|uniref:hypothetical protein n=1 Tax=Tepidibacter mesophilus TaxID=655607 RepID=UPI000C072434|nr:hypothetical protein [Tepidibacter mesophilus]
MKKRLLPIAMCLMLVFGIMTTAYASSDYSTDYETYIELKITDRDTLYELRDAFNRRDTAEDIVASIAAFKLKPVLSLMTGICMTLETDDVANKIDQAIRENKAIVLRAEFPYPMGPTDYFVKIVNK